MLVKNTNFLNALPMVVFLLSLLMLVSKIFTGELLCRQGNVVVDSFKLDVFLSLRIIFLIFLIIVHNHKLFLICSHKSGKLFL